MAENKVVSEKSELQAHIKVTREIRAVVNPNGRGYAEDNVTKYLNDEVLEVTVKADTPSKLAHKVAVMLATIEADDE